MRILKSLFIIIVLLCLVCACAKEDNPQNMQLSPLGKTLGELSTKIYDEDELQTIADFEGSIQELDASYPIECIRKIPLGYRVSYRGEAGLTSLLFDDEGQKIMGWVYDISKSAFYFDMLSIGTSLEDVLELDPDGTYFFLWTGQGISQEPIQSYHYTEDGYLITIVYDIIYNEEGQPAELVVSDILRELI